MHIPWGEVWGYIWGNKLAIISAISLAYLVFVKTMPPPNIPWFDPQVRKTWFYNFTHVLSHQEPYAYPAYPYPTVGETASPKVP